MIRIITDGTSDILNDRAIELGIDVLPLTVHFGSEDFIPGINMTNDEFYEKLSNAKELPTTSQVNPYEFEKVFKKYINAGDDIIGIFISEFLSGTYQSAVIAKENIGADNIYLIDSQTATLAMVLLIEEAVRMRDNDTPVDEIVSELHNLVSKVHFMSAVDSLDYLKMGGRISSSTAFIGGLLGMNPIVATINGKVESIGKARGKKACNQFLLNKFLEDNGDTTAPIAFAHSSAPDRMQDCVDFMKKNLELTKIVKGEMGPVVGTHIGPGCVGIAYFSR